jgi:hypothetical protein
MQLHKNEQALRQQLGIPDDSQRVLVFAESSHWDPNWMLTSEEYFKRYVQKNLDLAIEELLNEPRRIYSIECMFFLRMYWDRVPEQRRNVRELVNTGRFRLTSSGVTTADTLIPSTEAILRDLLLGQEWLRANRMFQEPKLAYFTDSFGCSPGLPSILKAAGFDRTTITRIDGMRFPGSGFRRLKKPLNVQTSADRLLGDEETLDFIWRDHSGAEVLCHWNAFTYGQGDMLASRGLIRLYDFPTSFSDQSEFNLTRRIHKYEKQLRPYTKTPYMFCPIGFDFVRPIPNLISLLDRYNHTRYPKTGLWVVNAGLDDYLELVNFHREKLPVLELDPNPYWTGFYSSRPTVKRLSHDLVESLVLSEHLSLLSEDSQSIKHISKHLQKLWWNAAVANHHDFITGTSPDRIVEHEQIPWLNETLLHTENLLQELTPEILPEDIAVKSNSSPSFKEQEGHIAIKTLDYSIELSEHDGGTITQFQPNHSHRSVLHEHSNDVVSYRDSGGLWRMGYEFRGGTWKEDGQGNKQPVRLDLREANHSLEIGGTMELRGQSLHKQIWIRNDTPWIHFQIIGRAASHHTFTVRFMLALEASKLVMDAPGGIVSRPLKKVYDPTYWPLHRFIHLVDTTSGEGIAIFQRHPGAVSYNKEGMLELVAFRNAHRERAYGFLPQPGNPAWGSEKEDFVFEYALMFTPRGNWQDNRLPQIAKSFRLSAKSYKRRRHLWTLAASHFSIDREDVTVTAAKAASRGEGWVLRLCSSSAMGKPIQIKCLRSEVMEAYLCDARERDLGVLEVEDGVVYLEMPGTIATLRLLF